MKAKKQFKIEELRQICQTPVQNQDWNSIIHNIHVCYKKGFPLRMPFLNLLNFDKIPRSTFFPHPIGIFISHDREIGENCVIFQLVTIGRRYAYKNSIKEETGRSRIGNGVYIGVGAIILGDINIGDNSVIGAGAIVLKDVPPNTIVKDVWK